MSEGKKITFTAEILKNPSLNAGYILFPYDTMGIFGRKGRIKVKAKFDGSVEYRGSLVNMGLDCHLLGITQEIRKQLGKTFGDMVDVEIIEDLEERIVPVPEYIQSVLVENPNEKDIFEKMSFTHRKEYINWIESAKKTETREKRLIDFIKQLNSKIKQ